MNDYLPQLVLTLSFHKKALADFREAQQLLVAAQKQLDCATEQLQDKLDQYQKQGNP